MQRPQQQIDELTDAAHHHPKPRVRVKALAVRAVISGMPRTQVAQVFATSRQSVGKWVSDYQEGGISALQVAPGRGRKPTVDEKELVDYALQSPHNFGINRSRWTLRLLAQTVPSLRGFTDAGVRVALKRCGLSYKRGQPWMLSPDPQYEKKRQVIAAALEHARRHPQSVVAVFEDEASFYRQPSQGWLWSWAGRQQPRMAWSQRSNTLVRAAAGLDTSSGTPAGSGSDCDIQVGDLLVWKVSEAYLTEDVQAGATEVPISDAALFEAGQLVEIGAGATREQATVAEGGYPLQGSGCDALILTTELQHDHAEQEAAVLVRRFQVLYVRSWPGIDHHLELALNEITI